MGILQDRSVEKLYIQLIQSKFLICLEEIWTTTHRGQNAPSILSTRKVVGGAVPCALHRPKTLLDDKELWNESKP